jgi:hypothetical protein
VNVVKIERMMNIEILFVIAAGVSEALDEEVDPCENF